MVLRNFNATDIGQLQKSKYGSETEAELKKLIAAWNRKVHDAAYFEMFALETEGQIVGEASLYERSEHIVSCGMEIYPAFRGRGYATQAYGILLDAARAQGYTVAVVQVLAENAASIALHRKAGFEAEEYTYLNRKGQPVYYFIKPLSGRGGERS